MNPYMSSRQDRGREAVRSHLKPHLHHTCSLFLGSQIKKQRISYIITLEIKRVEVIEKSKMWNQGKGICRKGTFLNKIQVQPALTGQRAKTDMLTLFPNYHGIYFFIPFKEAGNLIETFLSKADLQFCIQAL